MTPCPVPFCCVQCQSIATNQLCNMLCCKCLGSWGPTSPRPTNQPPTNYHHPPPSTTIPSTSHHHRGVQIGFLELKSNLKSRGQKLCQIKSCSSLVRSSNQIIKSNSLNTPMAFQQSNQISNQIKGSKIVSNQIMNKSNHAHIWSNHQIKPSNQTV